MSKSFMSSGLIESKKTLVLWNNVFLTCTEKMLIYSPTVPGPLV